MCKKGSGSTTKVRLFYEFRRHSGPFIFESGMAFARFSIMQRPEACLIGWMREALQRTAVGTELSGDGFRPGEAAVWWHGMFRLAAAHGVAGVVWPVVGRLSGAAAPPREVRLAWACHVQQLEKRWLAQRDAVVRLAALSREEGLPMLLLKGYGLSRLYPVPALRPCGDVDVWFFGRRREADRCLAERFGPPERAFDGHHTTFRIGRVAVENHACFFDPRTHASNVRLEPLLERLAVSGPAAVDVGGERVLLPSPQFGALHLLRHAAVHFAAAGFGCATWPTGGSFWTGAGKRSIGLFLRSRRGVCGWSGFSIASMRCVSVIWGSTPRRSRRPCAVQRSRAGCWRRPCGVPTCRRHRFEGGCFAGGGAGGNTGWSTTSLCLRPFFVRHGPMLRRAWRAIEPGCMGRFAFCHCGWPQLRT